MKLLDSLRPSALMSRASRRNKERLSVEEVTDKNLDDALQRLTVATASNIEVCKKVKRRQSSGKLKLVTPPKVNGSVHCVLFVDDDAVVLKTVEYTLGSHFDILTATNGEAALQLLHANPGLVDLIVSDQRMPDMAGDELLRQCRSLWPTIPRILMSAYHDIDALRRAVNYGGISATVPKPFERKDLVSIIEEFAAPAHVSVAP